MRFGAAAAPVQTAAAGPPWNIDDPEQSRNLVTARAATPHVLSGAIGASQIRHKRKTTVIETPAKDGLSRMDSPAGSRKPPAAHKMATAHGYLTHAERVPPKKNKKTLECEHTHAATRGRRTRSPYHPADRSHLQGGRSRVSSRKARRRILSGC